ELLDAVERKGGWADQVVRGTQSSKEKETDRGRAKETARGDFERQAKIAAERIEQLKKQGKDEAAKQLEKRIAEYKERLESQTKEVKPAADAAKSEGTKISNTDAVIKDAYLRTLSRLPTDEEVGKSKAFINTCETADEAARGLMWALLNTKEFIVNH